MPRNTRPWSRGVDLALFRPQPRREWQLPRPVFLYVGRVAVEKNIEAFLGLDLPGSKGRGGGWAAVGDAAAAAHGRAFSRAPARGRVGRGLCRRGDPRPVFPSLTDTFGLVLLEALACATPVAAFPVTGPLDVLDGAANVGALDADLGQPALAR